jgi:hypothetical protein
VRLAQFPVMNRLPLPQVTLCAVDTRAPVLAAQALLHSMRQVDFGRVLLFTHAWVPPVVLPGVEIVEIEPIGSGAEYSQFVLRKLPTYIRSSHALIAQWDGFVLDASAWSDEFLVHDYVGAPWPEQPEHRQVGNGGFSLRSRRFLQAGLDLRITAEHPEDQVMCRDFRPFLEEVHGISFAPPRLARRFAFENEAPGGATFGFHGPYNLPLVLPEAEMIETMRRLPDAFFRSRDGRRLARAMLLKRMAAGARYCLRRRVAAGRHDPNTRLMGAAASLLGLLSPGAKA